MAWLSNEEQSVNLLLKARLMQMCELARQNLQRAWLCGMIIESENVVLKLEI